MAYCTENSMVAWATTNPSWKTNQLNIPIPTLYDNEDGSHCTHRNFYLERPIQSFKIPLKFYDSGIDTNIMSVFHANPFASYYANLTNSSYDGGRIGMLIDGTALHPQLDYIGEVNCNLAACGEHIGEGGDSAPHQHGDPYGPECLYYNTTKWYPTPSSHPPLIGFAYDGAWIYGRYFLSTQQGYNVPLDNCGGHSHDNMGYHYHTQVFQKTTTFKKVSTTYAAYSPGPLHCLRGNVSDKVNYPDFFG